ncbi:MAG: GNAT family N-acetyltransferase [Clostridia bacterium]|nr:GNAT family N-acetyltransferase [Clostridia bacterium]
MISIFMGSAVFCSAPILNQSKEVTNMSCIYIDKLRRDNISVIVAWNTGKDADFLQQWSGRGYTHPLTDDQIDAHLAEGAEVFEILCDGEMIGTIELMRRKEGKVGHIGRFLLDPARTGQGLGTAAMKTFLAYAKDELGLQGITLSVFDFNAAAHRCYEKCGFTETERVTRPSGWIAIQMRREL